MLDRRRINGPPGGTKAPVFTSVLPADEGAARPKRSRKAKELRKIFLKTGLTPSASGSAYLELAPPILPSQSKSFTPPSSSLKLTCAVNGPKPLPRSAPFSPNLVLSTHVKFAPFASRHRRGYLRDTSERDLGVHLETALRGAIIGERWPKSGLDVTITILEGEDDRWWGDALGSATSSGTYGWGMMNVLAGCITVASAAIADARIDCLDLVAGGVSAIVVKDDNKGKGMQEEDNAMQESAAQDRSLILDPNPAEHKDIVSVCLVGYMPSRDEMTELWLKGDIPAFSPTGRDAGLSYDALIDGAIDAARGSRAVLAEAVRESAERFANRIDEPLATTAEDDDVEMQL